MSAYRVFTVSSGSVSEGVRVGTFTLSSGTKIPAVVVGEEGRGRSQGVLPVQLAKLQHKAWEKGGEVNLRFAEVGKTRSGKPKLLEVEEKISDDSIIAVFRTKIGFRGGNGHTGDRDVNDEHHPQFADFPGEVLVEGRIAQGAAGRMGSGEQLVAVLPKGVVFCTCYSGRLYGKPSAHYYVFDGQRILAMTWEERQLTGEFDNAIGTLVGENTPVTIDNFSRHPLSVDQITAIREMFGDEVVIGEPQAPFFEDAVHFSSCVSGRIASVVAPADFLLEAQTDGLLAKGTVLLFWRADQEARKRGNHASRALLRFTLMDSGWVKDSVSIDPTVEISFKDGAVYKYKGL